MRIRTAFIAALPTIVLIAVPLAAHATGIPFFGPIVPPTACPSGGTMPDGSAITVQTGAAGWAALIQVANNIIAFVVTILILVVTPFMIAWAGFLYVFSPSNPAMRSRANSILKNTAIGIFFALAAWLIVDLLLTSLQTVTDTAGTKGSVQTFTQRLFNGGDICLKIETQKLNQKDPGTTPQGSLTTLGSCPAGSTQSGGKCETCTIAGCDYTLPYGYACSGGGTFDQSTGQCQTCTGGDEGGCTTSAPTSSYATNTGTYGVSGQQCASDNTACSVSSLQAVGMTSSQANVMSCIAVTESSGNPNTLPYNVAHPESNSTACGTFQITQTTWNGAASGSCASFSNCTNAACNAQVAATLVSKNGYNDWTCAGCNSKAQGCVTQYSGT